MSTNGEQGYAPSPLATARMLTVILIVAWPGRTAKAVNPTPVMGTTRGLAERYVQYVAGRTELDYVSLRFGNVLGSAGSVVPTIPEASQLVLQATLDRSGEVLALNMVEAVKVGELVESMIHLLRLEPYDDIGPVHQAVSRREALRETRTDRGRRRGDPSLEDLHRPRHHVRLVRGRGRYRAVGTSHQPTGA